MITREELIAIGHYNKPHGVNGEISATVDVDIDLVRALSCLVSDMDGIFVPFYVNACRPKTAETILLTIDGIDNEQEASRLVNHDIYALKTEFSLESEEADADGTRVGEITGVDISTVNAIFIVDRDGDEVMVPATDELIVEFDTDNNLMVMDLPQGLLDLND